MNTVDASLIEVKSLEIYASTSCKIKLTYVISKYFFNIYIKCKRKDPFPHFDMKTYL